MEYHILLFTVILILVIIRVIYSELSSHKMQTASRTPINIAINTAHTRASWEWEIEMRLRELEVAAD